MVESTEPKLLVSVVIPNHNYGNYIGEAIASVAAQTYARVELIVVDDGSADDSRQRITDVLERHASRWEHYETVFLPRNRGKNGALNSALPLVRGEVTVIFDADDLLEPSYLEETLAVLTQSAQRDPAVAFVYTDSILVDSTGAVLAPGYATSFSRTLIESSSYIPECAPTFTHVLREVLPLHEHVRMATKHHRWRRIIRSGAVGVHLPRPLLRYRMHENNLSGIGRKVREELARGSRNAFILSGLWPTDLEDSLELNGWEPCSGLRSGDDPAVVPRDD